MTVLAEIGFYESWNRMFDSLESSTPLMGEMLLFVAAIGSLLAVWGFWDFIRFKRSTPMAGSATQRLPYALWFSIAGAFAVAPRFLFGVVLYFVDAVVNAGLGLFPSG